MPDIDLTPMNEAAARALFAEDLADRYIRRMPPLSAEQKAEHRIRFREAFARDWDAGIIDGDTVLRFRELALAATLVNWKDVARQAWERAVEEIKNDYPEASDHLEVSNPWDPTYGEEGA